MFTVGISSSSASQTVSQTFTPVADAFVYSSKPNTNYGTGPRLKMDNAPVMTTFVRFDVNNLPAPVTRATLQVYSRSSSSVGFEVHAVSNNTWGENTITYSNAPPVSAASATSSGSVSSGTWTSVDVTPLIAGNGAVSIALVTPSTSEIDVDSRQGSRSPKLVVDTTSADANPPTPPSGLTVTSAAASSLALSWSASTDDTGVAGYDVFLNNTKVGSSSTTGYTFGGLTCATTYALGVEAYDAAGNHSTRTSVNAATAACPLDTQPPSMPAGLAASNVTTTSLTLSWQASSDNVAVAGYDVFLNGSKVGSTTTATTYPFGSLSCGTKYTLGVEAFDAVGNHSSRGTLDATTSTCPDTQGPTAPTNLAPSGATQTSVNVSWTASTDNVGVTGYDLYLNGTKVGSATGTSYTFSGLTCGTSYTFGVEAYDAVGNRSTRATAGGSTSACTAPGSVPSFRYAYFGDADPAANKNLGATLIDVGSKSSADGLPSGLQGMIWVGDYDNTTCSWQVSDSSLTSTVTAAKGDPKVYGWFFSDEPNPYACPNAPAQHQARSNLIHSIDPTTKTFVVLDSNGFSGNLTQDAIDQLPLWVGTADFIGLDPYPCLVNKSCNYTFISNTIAKADAVGLPYVGVLQAFDGTAAGEAFRAPTGAELQNMVNLWAGSHEVGSAYFAWDWPAANWYLNTHPDLESVIQGFYTGSSSSSTDTTAPTAPSGLTTSAATATSVSVSWTASTDNVGVTGYNVYNGSTLIGTTASTSYTFGSLTCGTSYTFGVEAKDAAGNVSTGSTVTASTNACSTSDTTAPTAPSGLAVTGATTTGVTLWWTASLHKAGVTGYDVFVNGAKVGSTAGTQYTFGSLTCGTTYTLGVQAYDAAGNRSTTSTLPGSTSACATGTADPVIVAAGDICGSATDCTPTANLIGSINPNAVLTLGDQAYNTGSASDYASYYDPNWGKYKSITKPAPGNHEYDYGNQQTGYFAYFNNPPAYYSYDIGSWHMISLNGEVSASAGSAQDTWLQNDLATHKNVCTLAYWHEPRWSSGYHGGSSYYGQLWTDLYNGGADVVLNGHDHDYERFAPQDPNGNLDTARGIREFVSGTGGESHYTFNSPTANSEVRDSTSFGLLKLTLHATSYDWKFVPISGATFTDSGSGNCH